MFVIPTGPTVLYLGNYSNGWKLYAPRYSNPVNLVAEVSVRVPILVHLLRALVATIHLRKYLVVSIADTSTTFRTVDSCPRISGAVYL